MSRNNSKWADEIRSWTQTISRLPHSVSLKELTLLCLNVMHAFVNGDPTDVLRLMSLSEVLNEVVVKNKQRSDPHISIICALCASIRAMLESTVGSGVVERPAANAVTSDLDNAPKVESKDDAEIMDESSQFCGGGVNTAYFRPKISEEVLTEAKDEPVESLLLNQHQMNSINNRNQEQSNHPTVSDIKDEFGDNDFIAEDGMQNVPGCSTDSRDTEYLGLFKISDSEICLLAILSSPSKALSVDQINNYARSFFPERALKGSSEIRSVYYHHNLFGREKAKIRNRVSVYFVQPKLNDKIQNLLGKMSLLAAIRRARDIFMDSQLQNILSYPVDASSPYYLQIGHDIKQDASVFESPGSNIPDEMQPACSSVEKREDSPQDEQEEAHFDCMDCGRSFESDASLRVHERIHDYQLSKKRPRTAHSFLNEMDEL
ncbi:hypothetical protein PRIPAC_81236 [Pristionchus pacificus]|uniref:C2H2-type domain-containing protein n=1 Tax=Pristionchus pacificus TaxID=54126 RepID=A0A2A6BVF2_PRIPA|nr:hypothetical protein PRIPAC_81236 [Pristionchus pacificus]|eukprot:PDM69894.1 hypothetical protein PRIPAC_49106 [Pristionchus pacificus]